MAIALGQAKTKIVNGQRIDLGTGQAYQPISQSQPPANAGQIQNLPNFQMPNIRPTFADLSGANSRTAFRKTAIDVKLQEAKDVEAAQLAQQKAPEAQAQQSFLSKILSSQSPQDARAEAQRETGINPREYFAEQRASLAELETLNETYNAEVARKDAAIARIQDNAVGALQSGIDSEVARTERDYSIRLNQQASNINAKTALMEAREGNYAEAQKFINDAVDNATADLKHNVDLYKTFYDANQDQIDKLDTKYSSALKDAMTTAEKEYDDQHEEKKEVGNLLIEYPKAGINIGDDLITAQNKASIYLRMNPAESGSGTGPGTGVDESGYKFTSTQLNKGASNAGLPFEEFSALSGDIKNFYVQLSKTNAQELNTLFNDVKNGTLEPEAAIAEIESLSLTPAVKEHLISKISGPSATQKKPGFLSKTWDSWTSWLSRTIYPGSYQ